MRVPVGQQGSLQHPWKWDDGSCSIPHIINREQDLDDDKGQELLANPMLTAQKSCPYWAFLVFTNDIVRYELLEAL
jgi:hypothetical protein